MMVCRPSLISSTDVDVDLHVLSIVYVNGTFTVKWVFQSYEVNITQSFIAAMGQGGAEILTCCS